MDKSSRSKLSGSSRSCEKVMEYCQKYGKDRELEKFMRFRSPGGSHKSSSDSASTTFSEEWARMGDLECVFYDKNCNSEEEEEEGERQNANEHLVAIEIESDSDNVKNDNIRKSAETPKHKEGFRCQSKNTQTPESVAKSHKRLEWDSLGDVGYRKSKSTSNISIVERMLLREFIEVSSSSTNDLKHTNSSESDIRQLEKEIADLGALRKHFAVPKSVIEDSHNSTSPLASSTHIEKIQKSKLTMQSKCKPNVQTVGTNTTPSFEKTEKFAQTSFESPREMKSQEIQVTLEHPRASSLHSAKSNNPNESKRLSFSEILVVGSVDNEMDLESKTPSEESIKSEKLQQIKSLSSAGSESRSSLKQKTLAASRSSVDSRKIRGSKSPEKQDKENVEAEERSKGSMNSEIWQRTKSLNKKNQTSVESGSRSSSKPRTRLASQSLSDSKKIRETISQEKQDTEKLEPEEHSNSIQSVRPSSKSSIKSTKYQEIKEDKDDKESVKNKLRSESKQNVKTTSPSLFDSGDHQQKKSPKRQKKKSVDSTSSKEKGRSSSLSSPSFFQFKESVSSFTLHRESSTESQFLEDNMVPHDSKKKIGMAAQSSKNSIKHLRIKSLNRQEKGSIDSELPCQCNERPEETSHSTANNCEVKSSLPSIKQDKENLCSEILSKCNRAVETPRQSSINVTKPDELSTDNQDSDKPTKCQALELKNDDNNNKDVCDRLKNMLSTFNNIMDDNKENIISSASSSCSTVSYSPQIDLGIQLICAIMKTQNIDEKQKKRLVRNIVKRITKIANYCELDAVVNKTLLAAATCPGCGKATTKNSQHERRVCGNKSSNSRYKSLLSILNVDENMPKEQIENVRDSKTVTVCANKSKENEILKECNEPEKLGEIASATTVAQKSKIFQRNNAVGMCTEILKECNEPEKLGEIASTTTVAQKSKIFQRDNAVEMCTEILKECNDPEKLGEITSTTTIAQKSKIFQRDNAVEMSTSTSVKTSSIDNISSYKDLPATTSKSSRTELKMKTCEKTSTSSSTSSSATTTTTTSSSTSSFDEPPPALDISLCLTKTPSGGELISAVISQKESSDSGTNATAPSAATQNLSFKRNTAGAPTIIVPIVPEDNSTLEELLAPMTISEMEFEAKKRTSQSTKKKVQIDTNADCSSKAHPGLNWIDTEIKRLQQLKTIFLQEQEGSNAKRILPEPLQDSSNSSCFQSYDTVYSDPSLNDNRSKSGEVMGAVTVQNEIQTAKESNEAGEKLQKKDTQQSQQQRSKIDTPCSSTGSESVRSFVRQRKAAFLAYYEEQKRRHYDQMKHNYNQGPSTSKAAAAAATYVHQSDGENQYSLPIPIPTGYYTYPQMQQAYRDPRFVPRTAAATAAASSKQATSNKEIKDQRTMSTEFSVPMGSYKSISTETTTHHYDMTRADVVALNKNNIGSQTERSLQRSRPIYETRCMSPYHAAMVPANSNYVACTCQQFSKTVCIQARPKGISYTLQFPTHPDRQEGGCSSPSVSDSPRLVKYQTLDKKSAPCLQTALAYGHPEFMVQAKKRKSVLNRIQQLRLERERELREIADENTSLNSLDRKLEALPPPVPEKMRLFPSKQMKAMTNKRVAKLPEVLAKQESRREERYKRSNRLLREIFNRRLRERVRKGKLTLNPSRTLI